MLDFRKVATGQAWSAILWGIVLLIVPGLVLGMLQITADASVLILARLAGAMLFALGATLFVARNTEDEDQRTRTAFGNATADLAMVVVIGTGALTGVIGPVGYGLTAVFAVNVLVWMATRFGDSNKPT